MIPKDIKSINFLVGVGLTDAVVTVNGVNIPLVPIPGGRLAGNVSAFAGSVAELTFSTTTDNGVVDHGLYFDDIQFSDSPVPEPGAMSLVVMAVAGFALWHLTSRKRG